MDYLFNHSEPGLFEIQAVAEYDETGASVRECLKYAEVKGVESLYGVQLNEDSVEAQRVRDFFAQKPFVVQENYLIVRTPKDLITDEDLKKKWPFSFPGIYAINSTYYGSGYTRFCINKIVSLDFAQVVRAVGNETHDMVVVKFSTEISGCERKVCVPSLESLEKPYLYIRNNHLRMAEIVLAMATYGSKLMFDAFINRPQNSWQNYSYENYHFVVRRPRTAQEAERLAYYVDELVYGNDYWGESLYRGMMSDVNGLSKYAFENSSIFRLATRLEQESTCEQYIEALEKMPETLDHILDVLDWAKAESCSFSYCETVGFCEIDIAGYSSKRDEGFRWCVAYGKQRVVKVIEAIRKDLLPLIDDTANVWCNTDGKKPELSRVAYHYFLQHVALDPMAYLDHENEFVRMYAQFMISGE